MTPSLGDGADAGPSGAKFTEDMVYIPGGEFVRGTSAEDAARLAAQYGVHESLFLRAESVNRQPQDLLKREYFRRQRFAPYPEWVKEAPFTAVISRDGEWLLSMAAERIDAQFN